MPIFTTRFALALFALAVAVTLLIIGMWQRPTEKSQHTDADGGQGPPTTMPTSALTPYIPFIMIIAPLAATVTGIYLASRVAESQRRKDEDRRRRALATILLSEIQLLHTILKDIHEAFFLKALHKVTIEPFHTAMYDQAGSDRLLFQPETAQVLAQFYALIHILRTELKEFRDLPVEHRIGRDDHALLVRTQYTAELILEAMPQLSAEGGVWPKPYPKRTYRMYPEDPEAFIFPAFPEPP